MTDIIERLRHTPFGEVSGGMIPTLEEAANEIERLRKALVSAKDLAEFWINRTDTRGMSAMEYRSWLALGHHSKSMEKIRNALATTENTA